jgi:hypothetical protein
MRNSDIQIDPEPLPPFVSQLLADRAKVVRQFPIRRQMDWRHSQLRPPLLQRVLSFEHINKFEYFDFISPRHARSLVLPPIPVPRDRLDHPVPQRARVLLGTGGVGARRAA